MSFARPPITGVYPIVDAGGLVSFDGALGALTAVLEGGARVVQLRAKRASDRSFLELARLFRATTRAHGAALVIDDRPDVALLVEADGVHLGQSDLPSRSVRAWLPEWMHVGVSCHDLSDVERAAAEGAATYLGFGPVFPTASKEHADPVVGTAALHEACRAASGLPVAAIGGITVDRIDSVRAAGSAAAAMIADLFLAADITARTREAVSRFAARALERPCVDPGS